MSFRTDKPVTVYVDPQELRYMCFPYRSQAYPDQRSMRLAIVKRFPKAQILGETFIVADTIKNYPKDGTIPMFDSIPGEAAKPEGGINAQKPRAKRSKSAKGV